VNHGSDNPVVVSAEVFDATISPVCDLSDEFAATKLNDVDEFVSKLRDWFDMGLLPATGSDRVIVVPDCVFRLIFGRVTVCFVIRCWAMESASVSQIELDGAVRPSTRITWDACTRSDASPVSVASRPIWTGPGPRSSGDRAPDS
jgi:hypothetical protein